MCAELKSVNVLSLCTQCSKLRNVFSHMFFKKKKIQDAVQSLNQNNKWIMLNVDCASLHISFANLQEPHPPQIKILTCSKQAAEFCT